MEDRSALFNQLKNFSQRKLKKVETKVVTASGEQLVEKRGAKGLQVLTGGSDGTNKDQNSEPPRKLDLQVGLVLPGFLIGSQDVAHDKSSLDSYGVTHILNLDADIEDKFEDDYNYKNVKIQDRPEFDLDKVFEECFDFIDDGRHYGNVLIHCSGTVGLSRSTAICIAYLMNKEKQKFDEAFNNVKEARSFVKPNEGFLKQLKDYEVKLRGAQQIKESGIDDPFALRKKQEIEQEKAMVAGAASVKNRMKMFGATLDTETSRSKSVSPSPIKSQQQQQQQSQSPKIATSKWSSPSTINNNDTSSDGSRRKSVSKSMTPEPRKSWQSKELSSSSSNQASNSLASGPPPPPPPMPTSLHSDDKSMKPLNSNSRSTLPPPSSQTSNQTSTDRNRMVFGKVPPPAMKIKGGLSIEKHDSVSDKNMNFTKSTTHLTGSDTFGSGGQIHQFNQRCASPLVLMNNFPPQFDNNDNNSSSGLSSPTIGALTSGHLESIKSRYEMSCVKQNKENLDSFGLAPSRTVSLGPARQAKIGETLKNSPFVQDKFGQNNNNNNSNMDREKRFNRAANELKSSLTELNNLIDSTVSPKISNKPPIFKSFITSSNETNKPPSFSKQFYPSNATTDNPHHVGSESPEEQQQSLFQWQEDLSNWKSSSSVNDLRSMFEKAPKLSLPPASPSRTLSTNTDQRSPSILRNSPWQNMSPASQNQNYSDYTIRRTTSNSSPKPSNLLRNPYRGQY